MNFPDSNIDERKAKEEACVQEYNPGNNDNGNMKHEYVNPPKVRV
jgi:hypothetical protein